MISVCMPVGPFKFHKYYLQEAIDSVKKQTLQPVELLLIDDMAGIPESPDYRVWRCPWRLSMPAVSNLGIILAKTEHVFQMSCDDIMKPDCLQLCWDTWLKYKDPLGYYWVDVEYSTGEHQSVPCGHAMVTKTLWRHTGGFPPESVMGGCDATFISILMFNEGKAGKLYHVKSSNPPYWHREHENQYTKQQVTSLTCQLEVRNTLTRRWVPPEWGRYE